MSAPSNMNWDSLATTPLARIRAVREYANRVFDDESIAATWMSRANRAVHAGLSAVGAACQTAQGFREAMAELARLERLERLEAHRQARRTQAQVQQDAAAAL